MADTATPFQMSRISIQGGIGAGLLIAVVIGAMLADLPLLRAPTLSAIAVGVVVASIWIYARRREPLDSRTPPLSLELHEARRPPR
jgi:membrane protein implicated in regulation of membrane protease activity